MIALAHKMLKTKRYEHTLRVAETAEELAKRYGAEPVVVKTAALLHDIAKNLPDEELEKMLAANGEGAYLHHSPSVWHAPAGALVARKLDGGFTEEIFDAIKYHCTGRADMGLVEEIVFLADYIEPARTQPGVEAIRELAKASLKAAIAQTLADTVAYLSKKSGGIHPDTLAAHEFYRGFLET